ncbi:MAG: type II secretion system minor pseudopilin GspK [Gammaproteobacteria bacterium]|nr:type II secretion system minor pseudopilin GspK [Gammaproteobacteria bacterium]
MASQRGAVLIIVLAMLALLMTIAVGLGDRVRFAVRMTQNQATGDQAFWYLLSAEQLAAAAIETSVRVEPARATRRSLWALGTRSLPVERGIVDARIGDGGNCFNVNSLVQQDDDGEQLNPVAYREYLRLLAGLNIVGAARAALADSLVDWIDHNDIPRPFGAETVARAGTHIPVPNALLGATDSMAYIPGYTAELLEQLQPLLCALPDAQPSTLNINLLTPAQAPLLAMLGEDLPDLATLEHLLAAPPGDGFNNVDEFWQGAVFNGRQIDEDIRRRTAVKTTYFQVTTQVRLDDQVYAGTALLKLRNGNRVELLRRTLGEAL